MKTICKYILILFAMCAGLASCVKEDFPGVENDGLVTFTASYETPTKTVLNGLTPYWTPSDKIAIFNGVNNEFAATVTEPSATASFKGELAGKGTKNFRAVTPYSPDYTYSSLGSTFYGLSIPQEQACVENTYDPNALVAIAQSDDHNLSFRNLGSLVKFTVISDGVTSVTLRSNNEEVLSGTFEATYSANPGINIREGKDEVTLKGDFKKGSIYYVVTLPAALEKGFIVLLNGSVKSMSVDAPVVLSRSGLVNLGELSLNPGESQLPDNGDDDQDEAVPSGWIIIGDFCGWSEEGALPTYDMGSYYKAFDVPAASLASFKFRNGDVWVGTAGEAVAADKWVAASKEGADNNIAFTGSSASYDVYLDKELRGFYITAAGGTAPGAIPAPFTGKSVAGNFNTWNSSANPMTEEGDYYVVKGLALASTNLADPTSNGFKFVDVKSADNAVWYGVGSPSVELSKWYSTQTESSMNICVNGDAAAQYDAYITKDMSTFCVVPAGAELPARDEVGGDNSDVETSGTIYLKPNANWLEAGARFAVYFFEGNSYVWIDMTDGDGDGVYECGVPVGYSMMIFVRMNPDSAVNGWDDNVKWGQTPDLNVPAAGSDEICYVIADGTWGESGFWTTYPPVVTEPDPTPDPNPGTGEGSDVRIYIQHNWVWNYGLWCWDAAGNQIFSGTVWPGKKPEGTEVVDGETYSYWTVPEAYVGKTVSLLITDADSEWNGHKQQTEDYTGVTLSESVYFYFEWKDDKNQLVKL